MMMTRRDSASGAKGAKGAKGKGPDGYDDGREGREDTTYLAPFCLIPRHFSGDVVVVVVATPVIIVVTIAVIVVVILAFVVVVVAAVVAVTVAVAVAVIIVAVSATWRRRVPALAPWSHRSPAVTPFSPVAPTSSHARLFTHPPLYAPTSSRVHFFTCFSCLHFHLAPLRPSHALLAPSRLPCVLVTPASPPTRPPHIHLCASGWAAPLYPCLRSSILSITMITLWSFMLGI
ncbi:hypothetical protein DENSPDRAFT_887028 [Dentipellis sp. KUC8613]|nr:hypothetical protein DENSPDRAFT_887028 [Dentipellis sp. KUC8613]